MAGSAHLPLHFLDQGYVPPILQEREECLQFEQPNEEPAAKSRDVDLQPLAVDVSPQVTRDVCTSSAKRKRRRIVEVVITSKPPKQKNQRGRPTFSSPPPLQSKADKKRKSPQTHRNVVRKDKQIAQISQSFSVKNKKANIKAHQVEKKQLIKVEDETLLLTEMPQFFIPPDVPKKLIDQSITRSMLTWAFGCSIPQSYTCMVLPEGGEHWVLFLSPELNPGLPRRPGEYGILIVLSDPGEIKDSIPLITRDSLTPGSKWCYKGQYVAMKNVVIPAQVWRKLSPLTRSTWIKDIWEKQPCTHRALIYLTIHGLDTSDTKVNARAAEQNAQLSVLGRERRLVNMSSAEYWKRHAEIVGFDQDTLEKALDTGVVTLWAKELKCVGYDVQLQRRLAAAFDEWQEAGKPRKMRPEIRAMKNAKLKNGTVSRAHERKCWFDSNSG